jgi:hypothetical protein
MRSNGVQVIYYEYDTSKQGEGTVNFPSFFFIRVGLAIDSSIVRLLGLMICKRSFGVAAGLQAMKRYESIRIGAIESRANEEARLPKQTGLPGGVSAGSGVLQNASGFTGVRRRHGRRHHLRGRHHR